MYVIETNQKKLRMRLPVVAPTEKHGQVAADDANKIINIRRRFCNVPTQKKLIFNEKYSSVYKLPGVGCQETIYE